MQIRIVMLGSMLGSALMLTACPPPAEFGPYVRDVTLLENGDIVVQKCEMSVYAEKSRIAFEPHDCVNVTHHAKTANAKP